MENLRIDAPSETTLAEREEFIAFVKEAGEAPRITMERVEEAQCLVRYFSDNVLKGTSALKKPSDKYRKDCFTKAKLPELEGHYPFELGYVVVDKKLQGRGLSHLLVAAALRGRNKSDGLFATSETSKAGMHRVLESRHFERAGTSYSASRPNDPDRRLALFLSPGWDEAIGPVVPK